MLSPSLITSASSLLRLSLLLVAQPHPMLSASFRNLTERYKVHFRSTYGIRTCGNWLFPLFLIAHHLFP